MVHPIPYFLKEIDVTKVPTWSRRVDEHRVGISQQRRRSFHASFQVRSFFYCCKLRKFSFWKYLGVNWFLELTVSVSALCTWIKKSLIIKKSKLAKRRVVFLLVSAFFLRENKVNALISSFLDDFLFLEWIAQHFVNHFSKVLPRGKIILFLLLLTRVPRCIKLFEKIFGFF